MILRIEPVGYKSVSRGKIGDHPHPLENMEAWRGGYR
jgi:hypothetical protein